MWWNEEVQNAVKEKRLKFNKYQESRSDGDKEVFREANKIVGVLRHTNYLKAALHSTNVSIGTIIV